MQFRHQMDKNKQQTFSSGLYLVSTPIGNMEDITFRALNVLKNSDIVLCEDTRRSGKLLSHFQIKSKLLSYHKFNEKKVSYKIIDSIKKNKVISLITDAGTPTISDPGMILVNKCIEENLSVYPIPGSSAATSAVSVSGFSDQYLFYGFLTKKENELENTLKSLCNLDYSIVFFIPAPKINFYISQFKKYFFDRKIVIAREMTKIHEEFIRGKVESIKSLSENLKGELTVVLSEKIKEKNIKKEINESVKIEIKKMLKKYSHKDVVEFISKKENLQKRIIYNYCLKLKK
jgi:16S rRNA (cytidine1402-2'-O)-methyltransferase